MEIALIADDSRKELMLQFCTTYCGILSRHNLCATNNTGKYISEATGLATHRYLIGEYGGAQQICSRISCDEIDLLIFFRDTSPEKAYAELETNLIRLCDIHNIPVATNLATAEILIRALDRGELEWRETVNPVSAVNRTKKKEKR